MAIALSLAILAYFFMVGYGFINRIEKGALCAKSVLISPALGIGINVIIAFTINRFGFAIKDFGLMMVVTLTITSLVFIATCSNKISWRDVVMYVLLLIIAISLSSWPMFQYDLEWVSYANDDMANHALAAQRLIDHGFFDEFDQTEYTAGREYSQVWWFNHVAGGVRLEEDLVLALASVVTKIGILEIFMPLAVALYCTLILVTAALTASMIKTKSAPLISAGLIAVSPLTTLGLLYQLSAQLGGLSLFIGTVVVLFKKHEIKNFPDGLRIVLPAAFMGSSLIIWYPELLPFIAAGFAVYFAAMYFQEKNAGIPLLISTFASGIIILIITNSYFISAIKYLEAQIALGTKTNDIQKFIFPYFMIPSGVPTLFGLMAIDKSYSDTYLQWTFFLGIVLLATILIIMLVQISKGNQASCILLPMFVIGAILFYKKNDFGLFKLAMFIQPFIICTITAQLFYLKKKLYRFSLIGITGLLVILSIPSQYSYVQKSTGEMWAGFAELPEASSRHLYQNLKKIRNYIQPGIKNTYISDTCHMVLAKYIATCLKGSEVIFPSCNFFTRSLPGPYIKKMEYIEKVDKLLKKTEKAEFYCNNKKYSFNSPEIEKSGVIYIESLEPTSFNHSQNKNSSEYLTLSRNTSNRLVFIESNLGSHYYTSGNISCYRLEKDPLFKGEKISALGRYQLFMVINPTPSPRLLMELTTTVLKDSGSALPSPMANNVKLPFVGRGSGRIYSQPIDLQIASGNSYVAVDIMKDPERFKNIRTGINNLWNKSVQDDPRNISVFARDISLVSADYYNKISPPYYIQNFPNDLKNINLEYSGIYEDGYLSERSFFILNSKNKEKLIIDLNDYNKNSNQKAPLVSISVNGRDVYSGAPRGSELNIQIPIDIKQEKTKVNISFDQVYKLPDPDGRIVSGKLKRIAFE